MRNTCMNFGCTKPRPGESLLCVAHRDMMLTPDACLVLLLGRLEGIEERLDRVEQDYRTRLNHGYITGTAFP